MTYFVQSGNILNFHMNTFENAMLICFVIYFMEALCKHLGQPLYYKIIRKTYPFTLFFFFFCLQCKKFLLLFIKQWLKGERKQILFSLYEVQFPLKYLLRTYSFFFSVYQLFFNLHNYINYLTSETII
jgi:hypothetical protein